MQAVSEIEGQFGRGRGLLASAYRQSRVVVRQADVPLDEQRWWLLSGEEAGQTSRYVTTHSSDLAWLREHHAVIVTLLFLLVDAEQGGQPLGELLTLLPESLMHGELRRIYWRGQPIAISLHVDPLPPALHLSQLLGALLAWSSQRGHSSPGLVLSREAREQMWMGDALPLAALRMSDLPTATSEEPEGGVQ